MKRATICLATLWLLIFVTAPVCVAEERPKLPTYYAEVVLQVDGMI